MFLCLYFSERPKAHQCLKHPWIRTPLLAPPTPSSPPDNSSSASLSNKTSSTPASAASPIGSPVGCRRAHSPPSSDVALEFEAHTKKYKYDKEMNGNSNVITENAINSRSNMLIESKCSSNGVCVNAMIDT